MSASDYTGPELYEYAAAGAALLDRERPGWAERIDLERLDMSIGEPDEIYGDGCGCVLAQLFGTYDEGRSALGLVATIRSQEGLGFISPRQADYEILDDAWTELIRTRT